MSNLLYVVYYVSVHALAIHYFLTAGANPGFVEIEDSDEVDESEMARKAIALKLMEHSPSGETDDSVEDWVDKGLRVFDFLERDTNKCNCRYKRCNSNIDLLIRPLWTTNV